MLVTRIKNNQITDSTITYQKIVPGTLVGSLFNPNVTVASNITVIGNLSVIGNTSTINSVNTVIQDPLIVFNSGYGGAPAYDVGMLVNRNLGTLNSYGGVNTAWIWDEAHGAFAGWLTDETGSTTGSIDKLFLANILIGNIVVANTFTASTGIFSNLYTPNVAIEGGSINYTVIGNTKPTNAFFTNVSASGCITLTNTSTTTSSTTGALVVSGGTAVGGNLWVQGDTHIVGNLTVTGNTTTINANNLSINDAIINLHSPSDLSALTFNDGKDIGFKFHYYDTVDSAAFLGRANDTGYLEWYTKGSDTGNVFVGTAYGTIKTGELLLVNTTPSTSTTTGAFILSGGAGIAGNTNIGGNLHVNQAAIINDTKTYYPTIIRGYNDNTAILTYYDGGYDGVAIGGSSVIGTTTVNGAKLQVNSTDSMLVPVGPTSARPSNQGYTDVPGMVRFNNTTNILEFYDGTAWQSTAAVFTVITSAQFALQTGNPYGNVDGFNTVFTLPRSATTNATIVTINGVVQLPTTAYTVSGFTLTFTEPPQVYDVIDVRILTTTSTINSITSPSGIFGVFPNNSNVYITTGTSGSVATTAWVAGGAEVNLYPNVTIASASVATTLDTFDVTMYSSAEYTATATIAGTSIREISKVLVAVDGSITAINQFGLTSTRSNVLVAYSAIVSSGNLLLQGTSTNNNTIVRLRKNYQSI